MNFKIEINYLNIDNYPSIESHFENMAKEGWLIAKVFMGSLFVYEKIEPQALDFSISPYEVETAFTRKTKEDLEEFQTVSKMVGWQYATKSYDLHIYYKAKASDAIPLHTDEEEEFTVLESIAKRYLKTRYSLLPLFIFLGWLAIGRVLSGVQGMRGGLNQILSLLIPVGIVLTIVQIVDLRKFLKINQKSREKGEDLWFNSRIWPYKFLHSLAAVISLLLIFYLVYSVVILRNPQAMIAYIPVIIGFTIGFLYRMVIKPLRKGRGFKAGSFILTIILGSILAAPAAALAGEYFSSGEEVFDLDEFPVLIADNFIEKESEEWGNLTRYTSLLIPESYEYTSHYEDEILQTEYSNALNESVAENLVERYIGQAHNRFRGRYSREISQAFSEGEYHPELKTSGFTEADFQEMYEPDAVIELYKVWDIIEEESITDASEVWNVDEGYFLSYENDAVVLREGKEVFYLAGLDFSDPEIIENAKVQLQIN